MARLPASFASPGVAVAKQLVESTWVIWCNLDILLLASRYVPQDSSTPSSLYLLWCLLQLATSTYQVDTSTFPVTCQALPRFAKLPGSQTCAETAPSPGQLVEFHWWTIKSCRFWLWTHACYRYHTPEPCCNYIDCTAGMAIFVLARWHTCFWEVE